MTAKAGLIKRELAKQTETHGTRPNAVYRIDKLGVTGSSPVPPIVNHLQNVLIE
jgi:hypothetical protein